MSLETNNYINPKNGWWLAPWGYKESIAFVAGIVLVGLILQLTIGNFDFELLRYPVNVIVIIGILLFVGVLTFRYKSQLFLWMSGIPLSVTVIGATLFFAMIMGLVLQAPAQSDGLSPLGFDAVTRSWPFVLLYALLLINLSLVVVRRMLIFSWKDYAFYLNHLGLLILLFAAGLGASDLRRYVMHVQEGETEWRVYNELGEVLELPVAIQLNDFRMEEYPPKLAIIDRNTGEPVPEGNPLFMHIDTVRRQGTIAGWEIHLDDYIQDAIRNSDSTYRHVPMPGACPAALITVTNVAESFERTGWVCSGNFAQLYMTMELNDQLLLVMTRPEPKLYQSDIIVYTKDEKAFPYLLEVNKPLKLGHWNIYQYSYDADRGKASAWSSFELVYDPWLLWVKIGLWLFIAGSLLMIWEGNKKRNLR